MAWKREAITDGEIDALRRVALVACNEDTRYPRWRGRTSSAGGHCYVISRWLVHRLGGHIGANRGHFVWLSPDDSYYLDLSSAHSDGPPEYSPNTRFTRVAAEDNARTDRFTKRADRLFDNLDRLVRLSLDYGGDAYPAEEPQAQDNSERFNDSWTDPGSYWHDEPGTPSTPEGVYQFVYANGQLEISPNHSHEELAAHTGIIPAQHSGPFAAGHVVVTSGKATWEVQANMNLHSFFRILKEATKNYGWQWGGMTDASGQPILDDFAPKQSATVLRYAFVSDHLYLGRTSAADLAIGAAADGEVLSGTLRIFAKRAEVAPVYIPALPHLFEWAQDQGLTLYAGNDNVIKTIPDLEVDDNYNPQTPESPNPHEPPVVDERLPTGLYRCPACDQLFPNWHEYQKHRRDQESWGDPDRSNNGDRGLPEPDHDIYGDGAHYHEMRQEPGITTGAVIGAAYDLHAGPCEHCGHNELRELRSPGWSYLQCVSCGMASHQRPGDAASVQDPLKPVDPWMDNEPGSLTLPPSWSRIVVLPARTWKEAARVDGFGKYAKAFKYDNDDHKFYVAYRNGDPLGYAALTKDGGIQMMQSAVENQGVGKAIYEALTKHYNQLYTHAAHEKTADLLKRNGWVQTTPVRWRWAKDQAATDLLEAPVPFIYDVQEDKIHLGHPGARTSDIPGRFTPGGIVEGNYEPGGKVVIRSLTSIPYTVRHMIELWYYTQPQLEVKSVHLQDDAGKDTRLASVGAEIKTLIAMDPAAHLATTALIRAGGEPYVVGGAVRDVLLAKEPNDIDLMVTNLAEPKVESALKALPGSVVHEGRDFKVFHYRHKGSEVQVALPRVERSTGPAHQDFDVQSDPTMKPEDDFYRRDFTAHAMGVHVTSGRLIDPFGGAEDIASKTLRTLHDKSLAEDPLRVMRAIVAHARHGLDPDEATRAQMRDSAHVLTHLPVERVQAELDKLFSSDNPASGICLAHETGVLKHALPEVEAAFGYDQNNPHHELELGEHLVKVLERLATRTTDRDLRLAGLLHDIGKPASAWLDPKTGSNHFYEHHVRDEKGELTGEVLGGNHESVGAEMARELMSRLRYPKERIERVTSLIEHHMYAGFTTMTGARRFLSRVGDHADDLFLLRWADQGGKDLKHSSGELAWDVNHNRQLVEHVRAEGQAFSRKQLKLNGRDLIEAGMTPGPKMGQILDDLTERVIEDPALNDHTTLLRLAQEHGRMETHDSARQAHERPEGQDRQAEALQLRHPREVELRQASEGDEDPQVGIPEYPAFPDIDDAVEAHDAAVEMSGQPYAALRDPSGLQSALGRAENHWAYGDPSLAPEERLMQAAAMMGHGVAQRQAFEDGNKRTGYWLMHGFLSSNGMPHVVKDDDAEMANIVAGWGEHTHEPEDMVNLWRARHQARPR